MRRLHLRQRRFCLRQRHDERLLIDHKQQIAFFHPPAVFERLTLENAADTRADFDRIHRLGLTDVFLVYRDRLHHRLDHADFRRRRRLGSAFAGASRDSKQGRGERQH